jgi:hypothetical protein
MTSSTEEITGLLNKVADGDEQAAALLIPLVYKELRRLAVIGCDASAPTTLCNQLHWSMRPT